jgi:hypothetical protein
MANIVVVPNTLKDFLEELGDLRKTKGHDSAVEYICQIAYTLGLQICRKKVTDAEEITKKKFRTVTPIVRRPDGSHHLLLGKIFDSDDEDNFQATPGGRLLVRCRKRRNLAPHLKSTLFYECNGLVLDTNTWKALAIPPRYFNINFKPKIVDSFLAKNLYDLIRVDDGTVVTLYAAPSEPTLWALASSNGYDVSSLLWMGPMTFAEVFYDLVERLYPQFITETNMRLIRAERTTQLSFATLDPAWCYTVGFRHHNFHPLKKDPECMWQIQCATMDGQISYEARLPIIPKQTIIDSAGPTTIRNLQEMGKNALNEYVPHYGFILRSRDPQQTKEHSVVLLESPLLINMRKIVYEHAPRDVQKDLSPMDRLEYNAMRAFLNQENRSKFLALFPEWTPKFRMYESFISNIVSQMVLILQQKKLAPLARVTATETTTVQIAKALLKHIAKNEELPAFAENIDSIVRDWIVIPDYAFLYLGAMKHDQREN